MVRVRASLLRTGNFRRIRGFPYKTRLMSSRHEKVMKLLRWAEVGNTGVYYTLLKCLQHLPNVGGCAPPVKCSGLKALWIKALTEAGQRPQYDTKSALL